MPEKKRTVLQPKYVSEFRCIGSACEDSCCLDGWEIYVDKATYNKYAESNSEDLGDKLRKYIVPRIDQGKHDKEFARITLEKGAGCPFLTEKMLCSIHAKLGSEYLCNTCATYPRVMNEVDGKLERCLTMSCPEVVRIALNNMQGISFEQIEEDEDIRVNINSRLQLSKDRMMLPSNIFWDIRLFSLNTIQDRSYSLGQRLMILGIAFNKIESLFKEKRGLEVSSELEKINRLVDAGALKKELSSVKSNHDLQLKIAKELTDKQIQSGIQGERYLSLLTEVLTGLDFKDKIDTTKISQAYQYNLETYLKLYLKKKEYVLENFLVNEFFKDIMPFGRFEKIWDSYIYLCLLYAVLKLHLNGIAGSRKRLEDDDVFQVIQSVSKTLTHSPTLMCSLIKLIKINKFDTLAWMTILVND